MRPWSIGVAVLGVFLLPMLLLAADTANSKRPHWEIKGDLSEACTCSVPCSCNFGQGPSPHHYCWSLVSLHITGGHYGKVRLDGLHLVRAHGQAAFVWYIDDRANPGQAAALKAIAMDIFGSANWRRFEPHFERARIMQAVGSKGAQVKVGDEGGFETDYLIGRDGKTPIVVENIMQWNVQGDIKGKTKHLYYKDLFGNAFDMTSTNSNEGKFDWTDKTPEYF